MFRCMMSWSRSFYGNKDVQLIQMCVSLNNRGLHQVSTFRHADVLKFKLSVKMAVGSCSQNTFSFTESKCSVSCSCEDNTSRRTDQPVLCLFLVRPCCLYTYKSFTISEQIEPGNKQTIYCSLLKQRSQDDITLAASINLIYYFYWKSVFSSGLVKFCMFDAGNVPQLYLDHTSSYKPRSIHSLLEHREDAVSTPCGLTQKPLRCRHVQKPWGDGKEPE